MNTKEQASKMTTYFENKITHGSCKYLVDCATVEMIL